MKKIVLLFAIFLITSCAEKKVEELVSYEIEGAWYWAIQFKKDATKDDVVEFVNTWANPNQTSYFFAFDDSADLSLFKNNKFTPNEFKETILLNKPKYGFYKMSPNDNKLYDDGIYLLEQQK